MPKSKKKEEKEKNKGIKKRLIEKTKNSANKFKLKFRERLIIGISSALGFLIALIWREPLSELVTWLIKDLNLGQQLLYKFISALVFTIIAVLILIFITRWNVEQKK
jgi:uncharacterized membrane protein YdbT with pleckstrin-like domain